LGAANALQAAYTNKPLDKGATELEMQLILFIYRQITVG